jgi:Putative transposase/Transposase zinc-binding domain
MKSGFKAYERDHRLPGHVRKAAYALMKCRTAELGGHTQECPNGDFHRQWYNSCRHRCCPQCNWIRIEQWLDRQKDRLLTCGHYHIIFTLPHELNGIWLPNVKAMTDLLFTCVRDTLFEFFHDPRHIGGTPGIIAALHTWSQTLILHPHLHCLVTEGGLSDTEWIEPQHHGYLLPIRAVMAVFRGKFLDSLHRAVEQGIVALPEEMTMQGFLNLTHKLGRVKWNVHIRERYDHGNGILIYLARYMRGGAMSNRRILTAGEDKVVFSHRVSQGRDTMSLPISSFIQRYLLHVPEPYTKVVRSYGIYAAAAKKALSISRTCFAQHEIKEPDPSHWRELCAQRGDDHPERCPLCGSILIRTTAVRSHAPPARLKRAA